MSRLLLLLLLFISLKPFAQVGIGTTSPAASAQLDVSSTSKGFLAPRMTTAERDAISSPAVGLMIVNISTNSVEFFDGYSWLNLAKAVYGNTSIKKFFGGTGNDIGNYVALTQDGGYIIAGSSTSSNTGTLTGITSNGGTDGYVLKINGSGIIQWQKLLGGSAADNILNIKKTADGGYIATGYSSSSNTGTLTGITSNGGQDVWVIKLDVNGNTQWQKLLGGSSSESGYSIQQTTDNGFIIAGWSQSSNTGTLTGITSNGGVDFYIIKLDVNGNLLWQKLLGGTLVDYGRSVEQTADGGLIVAGYSSSSNTGTLIGFTSNGLNDGWILKLDGSGNVQWQKLLGGSADEDIYSIVQTIDGGYIFTGSSSSSNTGTLSGIVSNGSVDVWVAKMNSAGTVQWQKLFGSFTGEASYSINQTDEGGYILAGTTNYNGGGAAGTLNAVGNGGTDCWIIKLDAAGVIEWQRLIGGSATDICYSIRQTVDGYYIITGSTSSSNTGSFIGINSNGGDDVFFLKLDRNGVLF
jgi:hypothetical protein